MKELIAHITTVLQSVYSPSEARELAYWIVEETTGMTRTEILCCKDTQNISNIEIILQRLLKKEPIAYIFGHCLWRGLDLQVNSSTLIPRPETAELIDRISALPLPSARVLDIGTGSGCIAIALQQAHPDWQVSGMDISASALATAAANAARNNVTVKWIEGDILHDEIAAYDIVVSNPPYITPSERAHMDANVLDYEPPTALFVSEEDPLLFYRRIAQLHRGTHLFFEINERFGHEVVTLLREEGYTNIELYPDQYGKDRFVYGRTQA